MIVVYPRANPGVFVSAAEHYSATKIIVTPYPVDSPFHGLAGLDDILIKCIPMIVKDNPDNVMVITSGGTTKMGHMVKLLGHIAASFGWKVNYLWVAKSPKNKEYVTTWLPTVEIKYADVYDVLLVGDKQHAKVVVSLPKGNKDE